ncbi:MAG: PilT/PilU family type 4a pilus ATPase [Planctomycetes bacterium]|nr:PilT/PilU family type 4a pilus ATPase [Planctomycetota bacterium]
MPSIVERWLKKPLRDGHGSVEIVVMGMEQLLRTMLAMQATDLHVQGNDTPMMRIAGDLRDVAGPHPTAEEIEAFVDKIVTPTQRRELARTGSCDLAFTFGDARLRVNVFVQQGTQSLAIRRLNLTVPTFEQLNLPPRLAQIAEARRGLVLVSGTTSSGKSTTLSAMIGYINRTRKQRIITVEDPVEYIHSCNRSLIAQVEVGSDTPSYTRAIRQILRQDPDVILIGELRDPESVRVALRAADTGHLVLAAVHAANATQTIERIIALFDSAERDLLLMQLSMNIQAVISQRLAKATRRAGGGLIPVVEILRGTPVVRKCILESRYEGISQAMANRDNEMQTFDQHLADLYRQKRISGTEALRTSTNPEALAMMLRGISTRDSQTGLVR